MREIALFSGKIYTAGTNFTRPPAVTVATNLNSDNKSKKAGTTFLVQSHAFSGGRNSRKSVLVFGVDMLVRHKWNYILIVFIISTDGYTKYLRKRNDKHPINQIGLVMVYTFD